MTIIVESACRGRGGEDEVDLARRFLRVDPLQNTRGVLSRTNQYISDKASMAAALKASLNILTGVGDK